MSQNVNLFEGIAECKPEDQALLAALLEQAHVSRFVGPAIVTIAWPIIKQQIEKWNIPFEKVTFMEIIDHSKHEFLNQTAKERIDFMKKNLAGRCGYNGSFVEESISYDVLQFVAESYKIDKMLLPRKMALEIMKNFFEKMEKAYKDEWEKADSKKRKDIDEELNKQIDQLNESEKAAIKAALNVDNLSASTIRNIIFSAGPTAILSSVVNVAGFSAYIALSVIVHTVFTTVLGITLPFGVYMGLSSALASITGPLAPFFVGGGLFISWIKSGRELNKNMVEMVVGMGLARSYISGDFNPIDERYLSYSSEPDKREFENESKHLKEWDADIKRLENEIQTKEQKLQSVQDVIFSADVSGKKAIASIEAYKEQSSSLTTVLQSKKPIDNSDPVKAELYAEEKLRLEQDIKTALEMAVKAEKDRLEAERVSAKYKAELEENRREKEKFESEKRRLVYNKKGLEKKREDELKARFSAVMKNLVIDDKVYKWLCRQTDGSVVNQAEAALHEYNNGSFVMHSRGKIQNTDYYHNSFGPNNAYRIYYCRKSKTYIAVIGSKKEQDQNIQWLQKHSCPDGDLSADKLLTQ